MEDKKHKIFDALIQVRHSTGISPPKSAHDRTDDQNENFDPCRDEDESPSEIIDVEDAVNANG